MGADGPNSHGSGPVAGVLEVGDAYRSSKAVQNYAGKGVEFVFDTATSRFVMGDMKHFELANKAGMKAGRNIVGGTIKKGKNGKLSTTENSGHFGENWTPEIRTRFVEFMHGHGVEVNHVQW